MAKYNIEYTCGHEETLNLVGSMRSREYKVEQMESGMCKDCARKAKSNAVAEQVRELGLTPLSGASEKQIRYGEEMRYNVIGPFLSEIYSEYADSPDALASVKSFANSDTSARYWIDMSRNRTSGQIKEFGAWQRSHGAILKLLK